MAKAITKKIKLQIPAGKATPAPPVGTVLGPAGINLQEFCTKFNDATRDNVYFFASGHNSRPQPPTCTL